MLQISELSSIVNSIDARAYFDKTHIWFKKPIPHEGLLEEWRQQCDFLKVCDDHPANPEWRLELVRPEPSLISILDAGPYTRITQLEIANDLICNNEPDKINATQFLRDHLVKPYQKGKLRYVTDEKQESGLYTTYTGPRHTPNNLLIYNYRRCRLRGAPSHCVHLEHRVRGPDTIRRLGISRPRDLLTFDLQQFWRGHLPFHNIDPNRLGRAYQNWQHGTHRRRPWFEQCGQGRIEYDRDLRAGHQLIRNWPSVLDLLLFYRKRHFDIRPYLIPFNIDRLVPRNRVHTLVYCMRKHDVVPFPLQFQNVDQHFLSDIDQIRGVGVDLRGAPQ